MNKRTHTQRKTNRAWPALALVPLAALVLSGSASAGEAGAAFAPATRDPPQGCEWVNNGINVNTGDQSCDQYDYSERHCDQGTGAGAGAGAGGPGSNDAQAGAGASAECDQSGGGLLSRLSEPALDRLR